MPTPKPTELSYEALREAVQLAKADNTGPLALLLDEYPELRWHPEVRMYCAWAERHAPDRLTQIRRHGTTGPRQDITGARLLAQAVEALVKSKFAEDASKATTLLPQLRPRVETGSTARVAGRELPDEVKSAFAHFAEGGFPTRQHIRARIRWHTRRQEELAKVLGFDMFPVQGDDEVVECTSTGTYEKERDGLRGGIAAYVPLFRTPPHGSGEERTTDAVAGGVDPVPKKGRERAQALPLQAMNPASRARST